MEEQATGMLEDLFAERGRVTHTDVARFAGVDVGEVAEIADDLGLGRLLRFSEVEEILEILTDEDDASEEPGADEEE